MSNANVYFSSDIDYSQITDEELVNIIHSGNNQAQDYLINRYKNLVNVKVSKYYMAGAEREDIVQEGLIGLYKAIRDYEANKQNSFKSFANICIERQLITAIKSSNRQKHIPLNSYLSLNRNAYENDENTQEGGTELFEVINTNFVEDPLDTITQKEYYKMLEETIDKSLSDFEKKVLGYYMQGESYVQIAKQLNAPVKSIDNAIQRIRKKAIKEMPNK